MIGGNYKNTFKFTGNLILPREGGKRPFVREIADRNGIILSFSISNSENNREFVKLFGIEWPTITVFDTKGNRVSVNWDERNDKTVLDTLSFSSKRIVDLGVSREGRREFISGYDMGLFLNQVLPKYEGNLFTVTGSISEDIYNEKFETVYEVRNIYAADGKQKALTASYEMFWDRSCIDASEWKSNGRVIIDGYIYNYASSQRCKMFFPQKFVYDTSKMDRNDGLSVKWINYMLKLLNVEAGYIYHMRVLCDVINGAEVVPFDESMLTEAQKELVDLGLATVEAFRPNGNIYGNYIRELRIVKPDLIGSGKEGRVKLDCSQEEFQEQIYHSPKAEDLNNLLIFS